MTTAPTPDAPLSPALACVVQVREGARLTPEALRSRVEHSMSGQAVLVTSLKELRTFMAHVLTSPRDHRSHPP